MGPTLKATATYMERIKRVLMDTVAFMTRDEIDCWQHDANHCHAAEHALKAHNLERRNVQVGHEVVLKGDLGCLHTLHS